jgi:hypothetical protein
MPVRVGGAQIWRTGRSRAVWGLSQIDEFGIIASSGTFFSGSPESAAIKEPSKRTAITDVP